MKWAPSPNTVTMMVVTVLLCVLIVLVRWPNKQDLGLGDYVLVLIPLILPAWRGLASLRLIKLLAFKADYRVFNLRCEMRVTGTLWTCASRDAPTLMQETLTAIRRWDRSAKVSARLVNRMVVAAGHRTITITFPDGGGFQEDEDDDRGQDREVHLELRGYHSRLAHLHSDLDEEVAPFLELMVKAIPECCQQPNFSIAARMNRSNPYLAFYLKDVPNAQVEHFQFRYRTDNERGQVSVSVAEDGFTVTSHSVGALIRHARRCLSMPALANGT